MTAVVELAEVSVVRGGSSLVDAIDWVVDEADRWVVIGPNGAGKTTLLQVLAAQMHPTTGVAGVLGEVLGTVDVFELRPRIGLTSAALADRLPRSERVSDVVVSASYAVLGRTFGTLSEGERKRVQIARALMTDPELMLLDEPAAGLDLTGREQLVRSLSSIATAEGAPAMVLVTHHVEEIPPGFTHALLLKKGRVISAGPIEQALTAHTLSDAFDLALSLDHRDGRWSARAL
jgi:iron complex transport system ATP-binding protein